MKEKTKLALLLALLCLLASETHGVADFIQLTSPGDIESANNITFDGYQDKTVANSLYEDRGVIFTRDDGAAIFLYNWTRSETTSSPSVLATVYVPGINESYVTHLNVYFSNPVLKVGAFFGNDTGVSDLSRSDFSSIRLSAYDLSDQLMGAVTVDVNHNRDVDQFLGLGSDVPISRVRFENLTAIGTPSQIFSVVIDDLVFKVVPEPSPASIALIAMALTQSARRIRRGC